MAEKNSVVMQSGQILAQITVGKVIHEAPGKALQKLSTIPEYEPGQSKAGSSPPASSSSLSSVDKYSSTSTSAGSLTTSEPDNGEDCAGIVLFCLFCRYYDLFVMLPNSCERAANRICPSYKHFSETVEPVHSSDWNCHCDFDCGLFDACHETGECLELAMEISEVCYR
ncbi:myoD family inhibitor domain-containing protein 2 [Chanos chanos]|uniref:MyoD family inhibitor domain-containing protein 2 n=1 Tax=Chanos chanos TaxID=29144 RepID=A0A6J2VQI8_CHACN|nr:myoD family inhibitor domain-containing protein 2-like [Chanos chanos]